MKYKKKSKRDILNRRLDRRQFLIGSGKTFLALPPLISLMPKSVAAAVLNNKVVRSVSYIGGLGINESLMFPASPIANLNVVAGQVDLKYKELSQIPGNLSYMIDRANFESIYPYMNVIHGLSLTGGAFMGHNHTLLAGTHSEFRTPTFGRTMDVLLEKSNSVYDPNSAVPLKALRIIENVQNAQSWDCSTGSRINSSGYIGDANVFNALFATLTDTGPAPITNDEKNQELVVDKIYTDLRSLENDSRLSSEDKTLVDRYISGVFDLQKKIIANNSGNGSTCTKPNNMNIQAGTSGNGYQFPWESNWNSPNMRILFDNYIEMIKLAFSCDLTRVINIQNNVWSDAPVSQWSSGGLHHECPSAEVSADRHKWGLLKMAKLAEVLRDTTDPLNSGDNILDNSSILWTNELGDWTTGHRTLAMPCVLFGKGGGSIRTGNYFDMRQSGHSNFAYIGTPGRPFKQALQTIMHSMGVTKTEYSMYGDGNGYGEFKEGINQFNHNFPNIFSAYKNEHNDPMPFLTI